MYRHFGYGCGYGADELPPATVVKPPTPVNVQPTILPPTPAPMPIPGVHDGMQHGMLCVPMIFCPFQPKL